MHVMKRFGRESYPRGAAGSPLAAQPFAVLGLSANQPFVDGVSEGIPFDTVVYQSSEFGDFEIEAGISVFFIPFGVYLVTLQAAVDTDPTEISLALQVASGSAQDASASETTEQTSSAVTISATRFGTETPLPAHVLPVAVIPSIEVTGGGNGNILASLTKLFVWKLVEFPPVVIA